VVPERAASSSKEELEQAAEWERGAGLDKEEEPLFEVGPRSTGCFEFATHNGVDLSDSLLETDWVTHLLKFIPKIHLHSQHIIPSM
jgi:hypothetical protein